MPDVGYNITAFVSRHFSSGRCALIAIWFAVSAIAAAWPQRTFGGTSSCVQDRAPSQSGQVILRSEVDLQTVNVQVKDKQGNSVPGLTANDFTVREDGKPQKIAFFDAGSGPVTVAVLVDSSSSMIREGRLGSAEEIAARFMRIARPGDEIWAMDFTESTGPFERITQQQLSNSGALTVPGAGGVGSAVYDAIATAICHLRSSTRPRQAIIVITDGLDEHSRLSLNQLIDAVRSQRAQLFLIGLPSRPEFHTFGHTEPKVTLVSGHDVDNPEVVFDRLAKEAGAEAFIPKSDNGLQDALKAVSNLLESEYTLAYYPAKTSRKTRRIEVKVDRRDAQILTSRFIVANPDAADLVHYVEGTCTVSPEFYPYPYESHVTSGPSGTVYRDDFSDRNSGWPEHPDSHYVSGGYELSTLEHDAETSNNTAASRSDVMGSAGLGPIGEARKPTMIFRNDVVAAYGPSLYDFRVSASMKAVFGPVSDVHEQFAHPVHPAAGLVFCMNEQGYYALLVRPAPRYIKKDKLAFEVVARTFQGDSFVESVIVPWTTVDRASPEEAQLAVEDVGDQITILLDGQQVGAAHDDRFTAGYVGFTVSAPAHASFSNLLVEQR
jgi:Ca-activated chloride channel homolog